MNMADIHILQKEPWQGWNKVVDTITWYGAQITFSLMLNTSRNHSSQADGGFCYLWDSVLVGIMGTVLLLLLPVVYHKAYV